MQSGQRRAPHGEGGDHRRGLRGADGRAVSRRRAGRRARDHRHQPAEDVLLRPLVGLGGHRQDAGREDDVPARAGVQEVRRAVRARARHAGARGRARPSSSSGTAAERPSSTTTTSSSPPARSSTSRAREGLGPEAGYSQSICTGRTRCRRATPTWKRSRAWRRASAAASSSAPGTPARRARARRSSTSPTCTRTWCAAACATRPTCSGSPTSRRWATSACAACTVRQKGRLLTSEEFIARRLQGVRHPLAGPDRRARR